MNRAKQNATPYRWEVVEWEPGEQPCDLADFFTPENAFVAEPVLLRQPKENDTILKTDPNGYIDVVYDFDDTVIWLQSYDKKTILRIPLETAFAKFRPLYKRYMEKRFEYNKSMKKITT
jgi:hypothetical protein